jgi:hypothetical protein
MGRSRDAGTDGSNRFQKERKRYSERHLPLGTVVVLGPHSRAITLFAGEC